MEAHTEKQEHKIVHMRSPSSGAAKGSPVLESQTTRSPAVLSAIQNCPEIDDSHWESLLPVTPLSI